MSEMLTPRQVAEMMGLTVKTVYQYLNTGQIPSAEKDERGHWQIPSSAIPAEGALEPSEPEGVGEEGLETELPPAEELTPEERAARRERERAAALAALYTQDEPDEETVPDELYEAVGQGEEDEMNEIHMPGATDRENDLEQVYAREEGHEVDNANEMRNEEEPDALDEEAALEEYYAQRELEGEETIDALNAEEAHLDDDASSVMPDEVLPEMSGEASSEISNDGLEEDADEYHAMADTHESVEPDNYVMDLAPADTEPVGVGVVQVDPGELELDVVDLAAIDMAQLSSAERVLPAGAEGPAETGDDSGEPPAKRRVSGFTIPLAIAGIIIVLLIAVGFIVNQSMDLFDKTAEAVPAADALPVDAAPAAEVESAAEPAIEAVPVSVPIQPKGEGETLIVIPVFAGGDTALNANLRDAIDAQANALGMPGLRAEAEPSILAADQSGQAAELGSLYQADMMMWGEDKGDEVIVNLMNMQAAGAPAWEAAGAAERMQPLSPSAYASFVTADAESQLAFLAGFAIGQSSVVQGDYDTASTAIQQAIASLDPQAAPPAGLDEAFYLLGWLYQTQQADAQQALDAYTLALQLNPDHVQALNNTGMIHDELGDSQQALFFYNQALPLLREVENVPGELQVLNRIGTLYNEIGDAQQALSFYNRALPLAMEVGDQATEALSRRKISMIHKDLGELDEAEEQMVEVIALAEAIGLSTLEQDQQALEEIQTLREQQESQTPVFRSR